MVIVLMSVRVENTTNIYDKYTAFSFLVYLRRITGSHKVDVAIDVPDQREGEDFIAVETTIVGNYGD
jgi:hypothetical protein